MRVWLLILCACGAEKFGDPALPLAKTAGPHELELIYSESEDQTGLVFRAYQAMPRALGRLELEVTEGDYRPFEDFAQPVDSPRDGVIMGAVLPGRYKGVRMRFALMDPERSVDVTQLLVQYSEANLSFAAGFTENNTAVQFDIADPMAAFALGRLRRPFRTTVLDEGCASPIASVEGDSLRPLVEMPGPLSDDGVYCVRVETGDRRLEGKVLTRPVLVQTTRRFSPDPLVAEAVILPIVDLEIPDAMRCASVKQALLDAISPMGAEVLEPLVLSRDETSDCRHPFMPAIDVSVVQERLLAKLSVPEPPIVVFLFITNLDEAPAQTLFESYGIAAAAIGALNARLELASFAPPTFNSFLPALRTGTWTFALDPTLPGALSTLVNEVVPFRRYAHPPDAVLPFFPDGPPAGAFGFKVCMTNEEITPNVTVTPYADFSMPDPGFSFSLETDWLPPFAFEVRGVAVDLEVCTRYCDLIQGQGWRMSSACGSSP